MYKRMSTDDFIALAEAFDSTPHTLLDEDADLQVIAHQHSRLQTETQGKILIQGD